MLPEMSPTAATGPDSTTSRVVRGALAALFVTSGTLHFTTAESFVRIVPDAFPAAPAAWGLVALLVAVFPANVNMAIEHERIAPNVPVVLLWLRLPLQAVLIWGVLRATRSQRD